MSDNKLTQEELTQIQEIRKNYVSIQNAFGQLHLTEMNLTKQLSAIEGNRNELTAEYEKTQNAERELVTSIQDKYGVGTLNIDDGTFTAAEQASE
tara:strand:- start:5171 stop:5455 length:285 start_codon:yes stop_codon:yes gene_type:complete